MNWTEMTLAEQLGNVGSEFERSVHWKQKGQSALALKATERTLDQLDLTLADNRHTGPRRQELARLRDEVCKELFTDEINLESAQQLQRYFMNFAALARKNR